MVLTPLQPKIQASKVSEFALLSPYKHEKEKEEEKNMTILTKYPIRGTSDHKQLVNYIATSL